ncbi:TadE/TadG family type IV pilus assembly protein [Salinivibrio kushneri]|uniref:TadE/TadG family type IV pilus assembly protein n=1 Tax=Salinivibrio kushneri TaxID=1908198 RepID=UPI000C84CB30|nr:TadE/TadG family type IV pilus assembly protein [Salinivibrio kushneri]
MRSQKGFAHSAPGYYRQQQGHAAILFALFIPILFGIFTLGTDGARAVQDKARLAEAVEVASLAVAGAGSDDKTLAKAYIQDYFPYAEVNDSDITISKINCENNASCQDSEQRFFEYQVSAKIHQPTWFPGNETIVGFGENYDVASGAVSRKYHAETVDVVLVADFSGSMAWPWSGKYGTGEIRYVVMQDIIRTISDELESFNDNIKKAKKNKLAVVGFDYFTARDTGGSLDYFSHLICSGSPCRIYTQCRRWSRWGCRNWAWVRPGDENQPVDSIESVNNIFNYNHAAHHPIDMPNRLNRWSVSTFYDIELTSDFDDINSKVSQFSIRQSAISGTASYSGIIRGAQIAAQGDNPRRLIILLSDGKDTYSDTTDKLIEAGMCSKISAHLNSLNVDGEPVKARMTAVGFAESETIPPQMESCVGTDNVFSAQDKDAIVNKILELITEEIGHLAP